MTAVVRAAIVATVTTATAEDIRTDIERRTRPSRAVRLVDGASALDVDALRKLAEQERRLRFEHFDEYLVGHQELAKALPEATIIDVNTASAALVAHRTLGVGDETYAGNAIAQATLAGMVRDRLTRPALAALTFAWRHRDD